MYINKINVKYDTNKLQNVHTYLCSCMAVTANILSNYQAIYYCRD